jgi:hypothetical protein
MSSAKGRRKTNPSGPADFAVVMLNESESSALRFVVSLDQDGESRFFVATFPE